MVIALLAISSFVSVNPLSSDDVLGRGNESSIEVFSPAADGDESSESITSFSETLADDVVLLYPDYSHITTNSTRILASGSSGSLQYSAGDHESTWQIYDDDSELLEWRDAISSPYISWVELVFPLWDHDNLSSPYARFNVSIRLTATHLSPLQVYNFDSTSWVEFGDTSGYPPLAWTNLTGIGLSTSYVNASDHIRIRAYTYSLVSTSQTSVDYCEIATYNDEPIGSYTEDFVDVSDWVLHSGLVEPATDGDIGTFVAPDDNGYDYYYSNSPSISNINGYYGEIRVSINDSLAVGFIYLLKGWSQDSRTGTNFNLISGNQFASDTFATRKFYISDDYPLECVEIIVKQNPAYGGDSVAFYIDYYQIAPPDEMGWQHDGSTTEGVVTGGGSGGTMTTDGEYISLIADGDGSTFDFFVDTTATQAKLNPSYYPFVEMQFHSGDVGEDIRVQCYTVGYGDLQAQTTIIQTMRWNLRAATADDILKFRIWVYSSGTTRVKFLKAYSIANFTIYQSGTLIDDFMYVDSGVLYSELDSGAEYIRLGYDPSLSVDTSVYNVLNVSSSGYAKTALKVTIGSQYYPISFTSETRVGLISGTLTSIVFWYFYDSASWSAIKFIEDGTAPTVVRTRANPPEPYDDEQVTIGSVVTDTVEVYYVKFNAITSPAGFNDIDYSATELTDNFWTYTFSSGDLPSGYYAFKVIASDGANVNGLTTEQEFVDFTVREGEIDVDTITLFGAGEDFTYMEWSFELNRDCTYVIREWSENVAAADTHSGSVGAGTPNIAWLKLDTADQYVNFTVTFTNGTLTYPFTSSYQVAQPALAISYGDWGFSQTKVTFSAQSNKGGTYTVYLDDVQEDTGAFSSGSVYLTWTRTQATDPSEIDGAIKFTDGLTTVWINQTYDEYSVNGLSIQTYDVDWFQGNLTTVQLTTSWGNTTIDIHLNGSLVVNNHAEGYFNFTRASNTGLFNFTMVIDGGSSSITYSAWVNVTAQGVTYDYSSWSGGVTNVEGDEGDEGDTYYEYPPGGYMSEGTIAVIAVTGIFVFFLAYLFVDRLLKKKRLDTETEGN